jgi:MraZ protein
VAFPAAFRATFGLVNHGDDAMGVFHITRAADDPCLVAYTVADFEALKEKVAGLPRAHPMTMIYRRFVIGAAAEVVVDRSGRVNIPRELRDYAGLVRDVVWVGELQVVELWSRDRLDHAYDKARAEISPADRKDFQEKYGL